MNRIYSFVNVSKNFFYRYWICLCCNCFMRFSVKLFSKSQWSIERNCLKDIEIIAWECFIIEEFDRINAIDCWSVFNKLACFASSLSRDSVSDFSKEHATSINRKKRKQKHQVQSVFFVYMQIYKYYLHPIFFLNSLVAFPIHSNHFENVVVIWRKVPHLNVYRNNINMFIFFSFIY